MNQEAFFRSLGLREHVKKLFEGYSSTVFCYGTTGSGKTFTMQGAADVPGRVRSVEQKSSSSSQLEQGRGLAPRSLETLFRLLGERSGEAGEQLKVK